MLNYNYSFRELKGIFIYIFEFKLLISHTSSREKNHVLIIFFYKIYAHGTALARFHDQVYKICVMFWYFFFKKNKVNKIKKNKH